MIVRGAGAIGATGAAGMAQAFLKLLMMIPSKNTSMQLHTRLEIHAPRHKIYSMVFKSLTGSTGASNRAQARQKAVRSPRCSR